ncbi:lipid scramblase CLPTM1L [Phlebotomus argentipes]|uniref:lipid scramblase CLPTM1L n=1 Tax=Phlebotomus argentipes TaxID=94469 RepID=UPI002892D895|nr:lipid scramblase CLPTM1L [Phlebotomus argentipes]
MPKFPSLTTILGVVFMCYIAHSIWVLAQIFSAPVCTRPPCFTSILAKEELPKLQMALFTSTTKNPITTEITEVATVKPFDFKESFSRNLNIAIPAKTRRNGTLFMHVVLAVDDGDPIVWNRRRDDLAVIHRIALTEHVVPKHSTFNLITDDGQEAEKKPPQQRPVSHLRTRVHFGILADNISLSQHDIPAEMSGLVRVTRHNEYLPVFQSDTLRDRFDDLLQIKRGMEAFELEIMYAPLGIGKFRLIAHVNHAMRSLEALGFSKKDIDEVKGIFSDTNVYILCGTVFVGSIHLLFDFLAFKNDVNFWRRKRNYAGLSVRTVLWRGFSQVIILLHLLDEKTSMIVLIPVAVGTLIELWKCKKILRVEFSLRRGFTVRQETEKRVERLTKDFDKQAMRYLSYLLYPLCAAGALYSLLYQSHKSWYSWAINSMVNGVYAFGFLFMLPQLFINYKLKSVATLPWRSFMYKAFNTFINDIFAFIITMPTAHRLACFRDDVIFVIYLYQRWLYPVDKNRVDTSEHMDEYEEERRDKKSD